MISRYYRLALLSSLFLFLVKAPVYSQELTPDNIPPGLRDRAIIMDITARIIEQNQEIVWNSENSRVTISGRPIPLRLMGNNLIIEAQFTPYIRPNGNNIMVAQAQVWFQTSESGISFHASMQTIPIDDDYIYFFPLGTSANDNEPIIEIQIAVYPFSSEAQDSGHRGRRLSQ